MCEQTAAMTPCYKAILFSIVFCCKYMYKILYRIHNLIAPFSIVYTFFNIVFNHSNIAYWEDMQHDSGSLLSPGGRTQTPVTARSRAWGWWWLWEEGGGALVVPLPLGDIFTSHSNYHRNTRDFCRMFIAVHINCYKFHSNSILVQTYSRSLRLESECQIPVMYLKSAIQKKLALKYISIPRITTIIVV